MKKFIALLFTILLSSCSITKKDYSEHKNDPIQPINRAIYSFNKVFDALYIRPITTVYNYVIPDPIRNSFGNFFSNISEVPNTINALLQGKVHNAANDTSRFMINTTFGVLGLFDIAEKLGLPRHKEDFGQTLYYWRYTDSSYLVLPILGPSSVRDTIGLVGNTYMSPQYYFKRKYRNTYYIWNAIHKRQELFDTESIIDIASVDEYALVRDSYIQHQKYLTNPESVEEENAEFIGEPPE